MKKIVFIVDFETNRYDFDMLNRLLLGKEIEVVQANKTILKEKGFNKSSDILKRLLEDEQEPSVKGKFYLIGRFNNKIIIQIDSNKISSDKDEFVRSFGFNIEDFEDNVYAIRYEEDV